MLIARKLPVAAVELTPESTDYLFFTCSGHAYHSDPGHTRVHPTTDRLRLMGEKRLDKSTSRPVSNDPDDGKWLDIDSEVETGTFAIITDVLPPEAAPKSPTAAPKAGTSGETHRRRTLDDMRRLSEEIKRKRESGG